MSKKRLLAIAVCAAALVGVSASGALAGEVKGPPGSLETAQPGGNPDKTGAYTNSNPACSASGLNDFDTNEGQNERITQTPHDVPVPGIVRAIGTCFAGGTTRIRDEGRSQCACWLAPTTACRGQPHPEAHASGAVPLRVAGKPQSTA